MNQVTTRTPLPTTDKGVQTWVLNQKPGTEREWFPLGSGLVLLIEPSGRKSFQARFRLKGSNQSKRMTLGYFPAMSVASARQRLAEVKAEALSGGDPTLQKKRAEAGAGAPATFDALAAAYLQKRAEAVEAGELAKKTLKAETEQLAVLRDKIGDRRLVDLEPIDIGTAIDDYLKRLRKQGRPGTSANKVLAVTKRMFKLARGWGLIQGGNPAADLSRKVKEKERERILFDGDLLVKPSAPELNELGALAVALLDEGSAVWGEEGTRAAMLLSLLLGFRSFEVCGLEWGRDVNLSAEVPTVTVSRSKTAAGQRTLPLPPLALALVQELRKAAQERAGRRGGVGGSKAADYVFPGRSVGRKRENGPRLGSMHPESLTRAVDRAADKLGIEDLTHHDLRRTLVSGLGELGFDGITPRIVGHVAKDVTGRVYDHSRRMKAMLAALTAWEGAVLDAAARHRASVAVGEEGPAA